MADRHLVLLGAGHAHVEVLRSLGLRPEPGLRLTLVTPHRRTPYSGMLPGYVAGHYGEDQLYIAVEPLARLARAELILTEAVGPDVGAHAVRLADGRTVGFDLLSIDIGAETRRPEGMADGLDIVPVKPIDRFARRWSAIAAAIDRCAAPRIAIVGGGAAGVELAFAIRWRARRASSVTLVERTGRPLPALTPRAGRIAERLVRERGIAFAPVIEEPFDLIVSTTGVHPVGWLAHAGLATGPEGFLAVDATLRSVSHPEVFVAGDAAALVDWPQPKAGVVAVRQGPILARNFRHLATGTSLEPFVPRPHWLSLISTGDRRAIAVRGRWVAEGRWAWWWKDWIDRRFMRRYRLS